MWNWFLTQVGIALHNPVLRKLLGFLWRPCPRCEELVCPVYWENGICNVCAHNDRQEMEESALFAIQAEEAEVHQARWRAEEDAAWEEFLGGPPRSPDCPPEATLDAYAETVSRFSAQVGYEKHTSVAQHVNGCVHCSKFVDDTLMQISDDEERERIDREDHPQDYESPFDDEEDNTPVVVERKVWRVRTCTECSKKFRSWNTSQKCYSCTLKEVCHGRPPEEGEFNTAAILSGTMTDEAEAELKDYV